MPTLKMGGTTYALSRHGGNNFTSTSQEIKQQIKSRPTHTSAPPAFPYAN